MIKSIYSKKYKAFQEFLIESRKSSGFTQEMLAERLERPQSFVAKYENGERRLDVIEFLTIAEILKIDPVIIIKKLSKI